MSKIFTILTLLFSFSLFAEDGPSNARLSAKFELIDSDKSVVCTDYDTVKLGKSFNFSCPASLESGIDVDLHWLTTPFIVTLLNNGNLYVVGKAQLSFKVHDSDYRGVATYGEVKILEQGNVSYDQSADFKIQMDNRLSPVTVRITLTSVVQ